MKNGVNILSHELPTGLVEVLEAVTEMDVRRVAAAGKGLSALAEVFARLIDAPAPTPVPPSPTKDERVGRQVDHQAELRELYDAVADEVAGLHKLVLGMGERIAAQSELLAKRAEEKPAVVHNVYCTLPADILAPDPPAEAVQSLVAQLKDEVRSAAQFLEPADHRALVTAVAAEVATDAFNAAPASPAPRGTHQKRLAVARLLANGPAGTGEICSKLGIAHGGIYAVMQASEPAWWSRATRAAPWALTDAGRAALVADGYVFGVGETKAPVAETKPPDPETIAPDPPHPEPPRETRPDLTAAERALEQCRLMAGAIVHLNRPLLPDEIAREAGLPVEAVLKRLRGNGPAALPSATRYFTTSGREPGAYVLTHSGEGLVDKRTVAP